MMAAIKEYTQYTWW